MGLEKGDSRSLRSINILLLLLLFSLPDAQGAHDEGGKEWLCSLHRLQESQLKLRYRHVCHEIPKGVGKNEKLERLRPQNGHLGDDARGRPAKKKGGEGGWVGTRRKINEFIIFFMRVMENTLNKHDSILGQKKFTVSNTIKEEGY